MHAFFGLGTTHFTEVDEETGVKEVIKLRVHSLLVKLQNGKTCVMWKEFMRDDTWLPEDGVGWPVFKDDADLDLSSLQPMPTRPISGFVKVEKLVQVGYSQSLSVVVFVSCASCELYCSQNLFSETIRYISLFRLASRFGKAG